MLNNYFKYSLLFLALLFFSSLHAQQVMLEHPVTLEEGGMAIRKRDAAIVQNREKNNFMLFLMDYQNIHGVLCNSQFEEQESYLLLQPYEGTFKTLLGGVNHHSAYTLFLSNNSEKEFAFYTFDTATRKGSHGKIDLDFSHQKLIDVFEAEGKFYMVAAVKNAPQVNVYVFSSESQYEKINFSVEACREFYPVVVDELTGKVLVNKISADAPVTMADGQAGAKLYCTAAKITFTFDRTLGSTEMLELDMNTRKSSYRVIKPETAEVPVRFVSQMHQNHVFQAAVTKESLRLFVTDLTAETTVIMYNFNRADNKDLVNSPIWMEIPVAMTKNPLTMTIKRLDRIKEEATPDLLFDRMNKKLAIAVNQTYENKLEITLGAYEPIKASVATDYGLMPLGGHGAAFGYTKYVTIKTSKEVYFKTLLDAATLEHTEGTTGDSMFDHVKSFENHLDTELKDIPDAITLLKIGNNFVYGYYSPKNKKYCLVAIAE